jgi:hypothetical protein
MHDVLLTATGFTSVEPIVPLAAVVCVAVTTFVNMVVLVAALQTVQEGALVGTVMIWLTVTLLQSTPGLAIVNSAWLHCSFTTIFSQ